MSKTRSDPQRPRWDQSAPRRAPFQASATLTGVQATGRFVSYSRADTWYPSWGSDDRLYSSFTDGVVNGITSTSLGTEATTGQAIIEGDDPLDLRITEVGVQIASAAPYGGRYPSAVLMLDDVWYYGTYALAETNRGLNWDILGPFVGFRTSTDHGATWQDCPRTPATPLFGEPAAAHVPVRFGAPHIVDFGKNMEHSPDGFAYMVGHGSSTSTAELSWISGDEVFLCRTRPSLEGINNPSSWTFFSGKADDGTDCWSDNVNDAQSIASWPGHMGCVTVTYAPALKRYLMCVTDGWPTIKEMDSYILESDSLTGPWRMVSFMEEFGKQAYFLTLPSRFLSADSSTAWLCYSANFTNHMLHPPIAADPVGSRYGMCLLEVAFIPLDHQAE